MNRYSCGSAVLFVLMSLLVKQGSSILCWQCNSIHDPRCGEYRFDNHTLGVTDCSQQTRPVVQGNAKYCRKIVQYIQGEVRTIRGCGWIKDDRAWGGKCYSRTGTKDIIITFCQCEGDRCNGAMSLTSLLSLISTIFLFVQMF